MPSPAKKRKNNAPESSPQRMRSIESFFRGQATKRAKTAANPAEPVSESKQEVLTDEELARKLQAEWDREDRAAASSAQPAESAHQAEQLKSSTPLPAPVNDVRAKSEAVRTKETLSLQSSIGSEDTIVSSIPFDQSPLTFEPSKYVDELQRHWASDGGDATYALLTRGQGLKTLYDKHGDAGDVAFEAKKRQSFTLKRPKPLTIKGVYQSLMKIAKSKGPGSQESKQRIVEKLLQDSRGAEESRYIVRILVQNLRIGAVKTTMLIALARAFLFSKPKGAEFTVRSPQELSRLKKEELADVYSKAEEIVKASYARHPNYDDLVPCLLEIGVTEELLVRCGLTLHVPLRPMLGSITRDLSDMLTKLQGRDFACEYKYDGQRAQVHCDEKGKVSIFSRHLELMTDKYPDLVSLVPAIRGESVSSFILEGEVVAVDPDSGELKSFQILTNRAKKNVELGSIKVNVCLFAFDLMYLNGEPLLDRPFRERRELLRSLFTEIPNRFTWVKSLDATSADSDAVLEFFKGATEAKCEGIMVKVLDNVAKSEPDKSVGISYEREEMEQEVLESEQNGQDGLQSIKSEPKEKVSRRKPLLATYEPDKRLESWLKVKKDYSTSSDTLDLIPIGAWHGQGRKAKWWSPILMAVRNPETGVLEAVTKCMSGFTDKFYQANKEKYSEGGENVISRPSYVEYAGEPDVWFEPQEVWEMAFADITLSPTYTAAIGLVSDERGLSLRFPRFLRVREDKSIDEASTSDDLAALWRKQVERSKMEEVHQVADEDEKLGWQED
ncbi:DNA ligase (ATP) [Rasamsonia emersonii CBS 393.64]|uniref:DNA ligase n=1 Tax=Rasamsonia emersonii (strain ATCC 16479 / CBS 393.64 / IMI 116815) TaxID=1408163 RepID=A0A0F4YR04_RASE3|nr:DNA ligase (ATP) [Rasamsonia emersonii CBS 393.64]KKA20271.1 DNA ligase (ATP) [Rasamsonia emersonii CBS 393.64]